MPPFNIDNIFEDEYGDSHAGDPDGFSKPLDEIPEELGGTAVMNRPLEAGAFLKTWEMDKTDNRLKYADTHTPNGARRRDLKHQLSPIEEALRIEIGFVNHANKNTKSGATAILDDHKLPHFAFTALYTLQKWNVAQQPKRVHHGSCMVQVGFDTDLAMEAEHIYANQGLRIWANLLNRAYCKKQL